MQWREYHEFTKHTVESLRRAPHTLDWANMPDPFRHYEGVPLIDLPADPRSPEIPAMAVLTGQRGAPPIADGVQLISQLLFYSAAISASKRVPSTGSKYALRVNPSSGNLHPTEFHFIAHNLKDWSDGLYHYRPSSHMAEQRGLGKFITGTNASLVFVLTSIAWREAWKYRDRAYRYCLHDIGHAWQALELAARSIGLKAAAYGHFHDDEIARVCGLAGDEWPMLLVAIEAPLRDAASAPAAWFGGEPNQLSLDQLAYPRIDTIHAATKITAQSGIAAAELAPTVSGSIPLPIPATSTRPFGEVARTRRSALDFIGGGESISLHQLSALLNVTRQRLSADFSSSPFIQLYLYVHRVDGLEPGVYRHGSNELELLQTGDQRISAAGLSLGQNLAGNSCVTFSMIADLDRATRAHGDRGYRYAHFESGAIGHVLYLAAEALGLRATGIGAFFDDKVQRYLDLEQGQVIYHFAIGHPVHDDRLEA